MGRKRLQEVISLRLDQEDALLMKKIARLRSLRLSQLMRQIILEWLAVHEFIDDDRKKALGLRGR